MALPLLRRKLTRPALWEAALARELLHARLTTALDAGRHIALIAGSGYGKTSLLAAWTHERPVAWLALDAEDADLDSFLTYLVAACEAALPGFVSEAHGLLGRAREREGASAALATLIADLDEQVDRPLLIVLDDYHLAASPSLDALLGRLLKYLPDLIRIAIATRKAPDAGFTDLIAKRLLFVMGDRDLAFDDQELARLKPELAKAEILQLQARTGGWPAAMDITAELLDNYLDEQVLAGQPAEIHEFLQKAALVDVFDNAFCEQVLAEPFDRTRREWLEAHHLIWALGDARFQIPQPLRGMVRRRFLAEAPRVERWCTKPGTISGKTARPPPQSISGQKRAKPNALHDYWPWRPKAG
jgi:LuxR family maltose regulon positive regulatory protein